MTHSPRASLSDPTKRPDVPTPIPRILVGENDKAASSSIDLSKGIATDSALEVDTDNALPPPPSSERIRRRSELRQKPVFTGEEFELPVLPSLPEGPLTPPIQSRATGTVFTAAPSAPWSGSEDIELASRLPSTTASSVKDEDTNSTAPVLSPAQKARHRWNGRQHFFALCYCIFLEGWNDGSTGPLLPTVQRYYNVRPFHLSKYRSPAEVDPIADRLRPRLSFVCF